MMYSLCMCARTQNRVILLMVLLIIIGETSTAIDGSHQDYEAH